MTRNELEQEALRALDRGNVDAAYRHYQAILKLEPADRRIRQRAADLAGRIGLGLDQQRHLKVLGDALVKDGNHRGAVAVFKQLLSLRSEDPSVHVDLAECYVATGYVADARQHLETALRAYSAHQRPVDAVAVATRLAVLFPAELTFRMTAADLMEAAGQVNRALETFRGLAEEFRRRGRLDEVGRIAESIARLRPDDAEARREAGLARLAAGEPKRAAEHLGRAIALAPDDLGALDGLARAHEALGDAPAATTTLSELARHAVLRGDVAMEAEALRRALALQPEDAELKSRAKAVEGRLVRANRRLGALVLAQPASEAELVPVVRAEVFARYGFHDRAVATLEQAAAEQPASVAVGAAYAEALAGAGRGDEAAAWMHKLIPRAGSELEMVLDRIAIVTGRPLGSVRPDGGASVELDDQEDEEDGGEDGAAAAVEDDDDPPTDPGRESSPPPRARAEEPVPTESDIEEGDRLASDGDLEGALFAYRRALANDPASPAVLERITGLRGRPARAAARAVPAPASAPAAVPAAPPVSAREEAERLDAAGDLAGAMAAYRRALADAPADAELVARFGDLRARQRAAEPVVARSISPPPGPPGPPPGPPPPKASAPPATEEEQDPLVAEARGNLAVGAWDAALELVEADLTLPARAVAALARAGKGDVDGAIAALRDAIDDAAEGEPGSRGALLDLAGLQERAGKHRAALRTLDELAGIDASFRAAEVAALRAKARAGTG